MKPTRLCSLILGVLLVTACGESKEDPLGGGDGNGKRFVAAWTASAQPTETGFDGFPAPPPAQENATLRMVVKPSFAGPSLRLHLTNEYGAAPLGIGAANIAVQTDGSNIDSQRSVGVTVGGSSAFTVPVGEVVVTDPVALEGWNVGDHLSVDLYLPESTPIATGHLFGAATSYVSNPGDFTGAAELPTASTNESWYFLSGLDVESEDATAIVAIGDSITDGFGAPVNSDGAWPAQFATRLEANGQRSIVNQGISAGRLLRDIVGPSLASRFERDVLLQAGARYAVVLIGINDLGFGTTDASQAATAEQLIAGYEDLIRRGHDRGIKVYGATLTAVGGSSYDSAAVETPRHQLNAWIRDNAGNGTGFDAVIDFDAATRNPTTPTALQEAFDSGDHLHPNAAGYEAFSNAIDLSLFE